jgi:5-formyltetrahydrofolate cyclo-ligase
VLHPQGKKTLRTRIQAERDALTAEQHAEKSARICQSIIDRVLRPLAEQASHSLTILGYVPYRSEVDVVPVLEWCWREGHSVGLPKVDRASRTMRMYRTQSLSELETGAWGIREPKEQLPILDGLADIDAILMPGMAFDEQRNRLGYGGGFYDRFLGRFSELGLAYPLLAAPAFEVQLTANNEVPVEPHDVPMDVIVTERRFLTDDNAIRVKIR